MDREQEMEREIRARRRNYPRFLYVRAFHIFRERQHNIANNVQKRDSCWSVLEMLRMNIFPAARFGLGVKKKNRRWHILVASTEEGLRRMHKPKAQFFFRTAREAFTLHLGAGLLRSRPGSGPEPVARPPFQRGRFTLHKSRMPRPPP